MSQFKPTEFVQVEHIVSLGRGEPTSIWRNALYVSKDIGHVVTYTDGTQEVLSENQKIRKAEFTDKVQIREYK